MSFFNAFPILFILTLLLFSFDTEQNPPIDEVIQAGCLPPLVELLSCGNSKLQFEACWALTNGLFHFSFISIIGFLVHEFM